MTKEQVATAMLAILNDRVSVRGEIGAWQFLADLLGIKLAEAWATVDEFEYRGVRFTYRVRTVQDDRKHLAIRKCWAVEVR